MNMNQYNPKNPMQYENAQGLAAGGVTLSRQRDASQNMVQSDQPNELSALAGSLDMSLATLHELTHRLRDQCTRVMGPQIDGGGIAGAKEIEPNSMVSSLHLMASRISSALDDLRSCVIRIERL
jgi:hypothetical protein